MGTPTAASEASSGASPRVKSAGTDSAQALAQKHSPNNTYRITNTPPRRTGR